MAKILIVEDEADLRFSLEHNLSFEGYETDTAIDGHDGLDKALNTDFDLLVLDIMMPGMDGLTLLKKVRAVNNRVPIMMLTAKSTEMDKVIGFELGADDYLTKPFGLGELLARVKALLRRSRGNAPASSELRFLDIVMDFENFTVQKGRKSIHFSQKEFALLKYLSQHPGQALDKSQILDAVWGYSDSATTRTIDTHVARVRRKLGDQNHHRIIQTVPTVGYRFVAPVKS